MLTNAVCKHGVALPQKVLYSFDMQITHSQRNSGLDVARTLAILGALFAHSLIFFQPFGLDLVNRVPWHMWTGFYAVELFFALSGFLIGGIIFRQLLPNPSFKNVIVFYIRRWLRTLPAYYVVLAVLLFFAYDAAGQLPKQWWTYILFLQNSPPESSQLFPVSWSLSIEQWSYLFLPLLLLLTQHFYHTQKIRLSLETQWLTVLLILIFLSFFARLCIALSVPAVWDNDFRKQIPFRLDAVVVGVVIAWIKIYSPKIFLRLAHPCVFLCCVLTLIGVAILFYQDVLNPATEKDILLKSLIFTVVDIAMAVTLCFFEHNNAVQCMADPKKMFGKYMRWGSRYAYSIYLVHFSFFLMGYGFFVHSKQYTVFNVCLWLGFAYCTSLFSALALYHFIEKPCMNIRRLYTFTFKK